MDLLEIVIITALSFVSALVTSILGFGAGLVLTPLLNLFMPLKEALAVGALVFLFTAGAKTFWYFRDIDRPTYRSAFFLSLVGLGAGFSTVAYVDTYWLEKGFAVLLIFFSVGILKERTLPAVIPRAAYPVAGGFLSVLIHGGGPLFLQFCRSRSLDRVQAVATIAATHFTLNIFKVVFFTGTGILESKYLVLLIPAYFAAFVGTRLGRSLLKNHINEKAFGVGTGVLLLLLALNYLWG